ncbi:MAG: ArgR family transcriptional regulator [Bacteroidota bacterium]|nr:ArgR family transcriptional regulator [Bacteroidota bacterium]MDP4225069.1 ArgR family transcriptional regulator [Bacteroidota bacterium]
MNNKTKRLITIQNIISNHKISTQEELLMKLEKEGFEYTQATLSRDLKFLKVGRKADKEKGNIYVLPETKNASEPLQKTGAYPINGFLSLAFSDHLAVIKTLPGYASVIASTIDRNNPYEIIGTLAGDDTILLIPAEGVSRSEIKNVLILLFPALAGNL